MSALKYRSREKRQTWTKQHEEDWNFNRNPFTGGYLLHRHWEIKEEIEEFSIHQVLFQIWQCVIPHIFVFVRCQDYLAIERFPAILKQQQQQQQHWKIDMKLCGLPKKLNKLSRWERLKVLPRIPKQWWEMHQKKTLTVGNLNYVV